MFALLYLQQSWDISWLGSQEADFNTNIFNFTWKKVQSFLMVEPMKTGESVRQGGVTGSFSSFIHLTIISGTEPPGQVLVQLRFTRTVQLNISRSEASKSRSQQWQAALRAAPCVCIKSQRGLLQLVFRAYKKPPTSILRVESDFQTTKKAQLFIFLERETVTKGERK